MRTLRSLLVRAFSWLNRARDEREWSDELDAHLQTHIDENLRAGMTPPEARLDALRKLGGLAQVAEACRDRRSLPFVETTMQDLRYAVRMLRKTPGFAAAAILTLALGIGANTAIFSVLNAVILKPLEYQQPDRLMRLASTFPNYDEFWISLPEYLEFREWTKAFSSVGAYQTSESNVSAPERPQRVRSMLATHDLFTTLRINPRLGRVFEEADNRPGAAEVAVLSDGLWRSSFGGDERIVGKAVEIDGVKRTVVGVMPAGFDVADQRTQLWLPLTVNRAIANRGGHNYYMIGRLADGQTVASSRAELETLLAQWRQRVFGVRVTETPGPANGFLHAPGTTGHRWRIDPLLGRVVGNATTAVWVLQGAVVLVLLIACANLSTLLLSRAESRRREFAVRAALGATLGRLLRQSIAEGCLLSAIGGVLGLGVASAGLRALIVAFPESLPRSGNIQLDWRVLTFTLGVALFTGIIFGTAPLLHLAPQSSANALKEGGQRTAGGRHMLRRGLVVAEVALAVALVVGAGLLLRTVDNLARVDAGFDRSRLVTFGVSLPAARYQTPADRRTFQQRLMDQMAATPGVLKVAGMTGLPPFRLVNANTTIIEGFTSGQPGDNPSVDYYQQVTPGYLSTMGIPLVEGREFTPADGDPNAPSVLVNQTMARAFWPGQSPIGRRLKPCCNPATPWFTVVGVVRDVKQGGVEKKAGTELYFNAGRNAPGAINIVIRTPLAASALGGTIQHAVAGLDPSLPVIRLREMDDVFDDAIGRPRLLAQLLTIFAMLALVISTIGTYGVLSYMVTERRREIGVRVALGATRQAILGMILRQGLALTVAGIAIGLVIALVSGRAIASLLFGVTATDPITLAGVVALIAAAALVACGVPGHTASRVDPMVALREE
ncbi:MAG TPA: ABC transporter permease [Vicinamibacterales bacterium]|nr:ABC transporter permease [Vicinamibacterales bacterium]